ncbi:transcriptional regulator [Photobacterium phosphoreum]|uniref:Transcriptional regulator n=1 Tax=Photobacterium phosphoreum TaxID=659 RepID=A0AAW4ZTA6_PHOPO|nr:winged helix-turn-helix domain-containing protein [Photobacterium phosphoreum]MCD9491685.1 transcriptional regulator [Photobacterium phosphoreum]MCF2190926.1 transcriptional regulator [Photobacterium phosphoreum]MCF2302594.1 transcriptional regulator [Photobacterium phosphoreum]
MSNIEQIRFRTKVCFIASQGVLKTPESTLKLNLSEQYILSYLIENHSTPVTKDDLLKVGWPDRIVTEASLFQVIRALRVKLNEKTKGDVIETLPRVGYQIREFTREHVDLSEQKSNSTISKINKKTIISAIILTSTLLGSGAWYMYPPQTEPTHFLIEHDNIGNNSITFISQTLEQQLDLRNKTKKIFREKVSLISDSVYEPLSIVYRSYISNYGIISKISNFYISPTDKKNVFDYSKVSFITSKKTGHYQALSLSAESLTIMNKKSQFISTLKITPKAFHWAYQDNANLSKNKALTFLDDDNKSKSYGYNAIRYDYVVAGQKQLQLILNESTGLYWLHSGKNNPLTLLPTTTHP